MKKIEKKILLSLLFCIYITKVDTRLVDLGDGDEKKISIEDYKILKNAFGPQVLTEETRDMLILITNRLQFNKYLFGSGYFLDSKYEKNIQDFFSIIYEDYSLLDFEKSIIFFTEHKTLTSLMRVIFYGFSIFNHKKCIQELDVLIENHNNIVSWYLLKARMVFDEFYHIEIGGNNFHKLLRENKDIIYDSQKIKEIFSLLSHVRVLDPFNRTEKLFRGKLLLELGDEGGLQVLDSLGNRDYRYIIQIWKMLYFVKYGFVHKAEEIFLCLLKEDSRKYYKMLFYSLQIYLGCILQKKRYIAEVLSQGKSYCLYMGMKAIEFSNNGIMHVEEKKMSLYNNYKNCLIIPLDDPEEIFHYVLNRENYSYDESMLILFGLISKDYLNYGDISNSYSLRVVFK